MVDDDSFLLRAVEVEAGWPSFEGLEAEREAVLARRETTALVDHRFASSEHVSCFKIFHLVVSALGGSDVAGSMIEFFILFGLTVRDG